jgi:hypothetical protein
LVSGCFSIVLSCVSFLLICAIYGTDSV